ncbi:Longin-like domain-containing protein [Lophiotrema nucula]|uniref:Longin-like domain-containing protein n=1 Tax=Lophiotrema nucula TaxID=690887 RepID=A0A6A5ZAE2_9PLEO|nr:Longin-like domain-containing protein [Lophiotrema nucula]
MKIVYVGIWRNESKPAVELVHEANLAGLNFFQKPPVLEFLQAAAASFAGQTLPGQRNTVMPKPGEEGENNTLVSYGRTEGFCGICITDREYDARVAHGLLNKVVDDFLTRYNRPAFQSAAPNSLQLPDLKGDLQKWQDPAQADNITKIQRELDETKINLHGSIQAALERGQKFEDMVAKSENLSASSKMFYTQAKKQNSCCVVM